MSFQGFTPDSLKFLADLAEHNDRTWFAENRERYERELLGPERDFIDAVGAAFGALDQRVQAVPAVNQSIFRINRDTRFSPDKSPYKTYAGIWFWIGDDKKSAPGYFMQLQPDGLIIGGGAHRLTPEQITRFRSAVVDGLHGQWLAHILEDLQEEGFEISEPTRKTVPKGFSAQQPRAELLKYTDHIHAVRSFTPAPMEFTSPAFVDWSMGQFREVKPLIDWLAEQLGGVFPADMRL